MVVDSNFPLRRTVTLKKDGTNNINRSKFGIARVKRDEMIVCIDKNPIASTPRKRYFQVVDRL